MKRLSFLLTFIFSFIYGQEVDSIRLLEEKQIEEIEITANKKLITRKSDRLVFNVEQSVSATGGDVMDILRITPSVKVENDNISLLGKGNVIVLIDDRPTQMSGSDLANYLRTLKSDEIKSIEVIKNPPAKYSAEGNAGVLNITTKKAKNNMWNATLRSTYLQSQYAMGYWGGSFNFRKGKWTLSSVLSYTNGAERGDDETTIHYPNHTWEEISRIKNYSDNWSARLGLDYQISDKITNGILYRWGDFNRPQKEQVRTNILDNNGNLESIIFTQSQNIPYVVSHIFNYHWIFNSDSGNKLSFDYDLMRNRDLNNRNYWANNPPSEGRNWGKQIVDNHTFSVDMEQDLEKISLNYGARFSMNKIKNDSKFYNIENGLEILNSRQSNEFHYRENTQALYISAEKELSEKWEMKIGLRAENTQIKGVSQTIEKEHRNNYIRLFPTLYTSYKVNDNHSFSLDYGRRISRPRYHFLNPFRQVYSPYSYSEGNPLLNPSYTHNINLGYDYKDWSITNVYYQYQEKGYENLPIIDASTNITGIIPLNFYHQKIIGLEQIFMLNPIKDFWDMTLNLDVYYENTKSNHTSTLPYLKGWGSYFKIVNQLSLNTSKTLQLGVEYFMSPKGVDVLDEKTFNNSLSASLKMLLLKKKMTINIYANDIFRSNRPTYINYSNGIKNEYKNYYNQRFIRLSVAYNLGKSFDKKDYQNKNQDEVNRTQ